MITYIYVLLTDDKTSKNDTPRIFDTYRRLWDVLSEGYPSAELTLHIRSNANVCAPWLSFDSDLKNHIDYDEEIDKEYDKISAIVSGIIKDLKELIDE